MPKTYSLVYSNLDRIGALVCIFAIVYQYLSFSMFTVANSEVGLYNIKFQDGTVQNLETLLGCTDPVTPIESKMFDNCKYFQFLPVLLTITLGLLLIGLLHQLRIIGLISGVLAASIGVIELFNFKNIKEQVCVSIGTTECKDEVGFSYYLIYALMAFGAL